MQTKHSHPINLKVAEARQFMSCYLNGPDTRIKEYLRPFFSHPDETLKQPATIARATDIVDCIEGILDRSEEYSAEDLLSNFVRGGAKAPTGLRMLALSPGTASSPLTSSLSKGWRGLPLIYAGKGRTDGFIPLLTGSHRLASVDFLSRHRCLAKDFRVPVFDLDEHWDYYNSFLKGELNHKALEITGRGDELSWRILSFWGRNKFFEITLGMDAHQPKKSEPIRWHQHS